MKAIFLVIFLSFTIFIYAEDDNLADSYNVSNENFEAGLNSYDCAKTVKEFEKMDIDTKLYPADCRTIRNSKCGTHSGYSSCFSTPNVTCDWCPIYSSDGIQGWGCPI